MEKYIKVTKPDGEIAVINASNRDYYLSIGMKVEDATEAEIREYHGGAAETECQTTMVGSETAVVDSRDVKIAELEAKIAELEAETASLKSKSGGETKKTKTNKKQ